MTNGLAEVLAAVGIDNTPQWPTTSIPPIPPERFGKDHWSTFAYVEVRGVDHRGRLDHAHMRCDPDRHPVLYAAKGMRAGGLPPQKYPTRLRRESDGPVLLHDHDDYDCLDDLIAAGLLEVRMPPAPTGQLVTGLVEHELAAHATWHLTERGREVAGRLRAHKADGGTFATFRVEG